MKNFLQAAQSIQEKKKKREIRIISKISKS